LLLLLLPLLLQVWQLTKANLPQCRATCSRSFYPLAIISSDFKCRCSWSTPEERQRLPESQCQAGSPGMAVFYMNQREFRHMHVRYAFTHSTVAGREQPGMAVFYMCV
jgi:hypothetical protein